MITGKNYIGNLLASTGSKTFKTFNPQTNEENEIVFSEASEIEIYKATELATEAFKLFQKVSGAKKSEFLNEIANEINDTVIASLRSCRMICARCAPTTLRTPTSLARFNDLATDRFI